MNQEDDDAEIEKVGVTLCSPADHFRVSFILANPRRFYSAQGWARSGLHRVNHSSRTGVLR